MHDRYDVVWAWQGERNRSGELKFGSGYLAIDGRGRDVSRAWLAAEQLTSVRRAGEADRLRDLPTLALRTGERTLFVAPFEVDRLRHLSECLHAFAMVERPARPLRLLVAGGGVAGLEATLAVRELAGDRVATTLLSGQRHFSYSPLTVLEPFGGQVPRISLDLFASELGARFRLETLAAVDSERRVAVTRSGHELEYDILLVALGARPRPALPASLTFGPETTAAFVALIEEIEAGRVGSIAFVVPKGVVWPLPLYELALMTARHEAASKRASITLVTSERRPLGLLGAEASRVVERLLAELGIRVLANRDAVRVEPGSLVLAQDERLPAERVIALPQLEGPFVPGLPHDAAGYLPTDRFGHVGVLSSVLAAGDATAFPIKQGGIAAQQAEVAASVVAARAGAHVVPEPFDPVVEARLFTGSELLHSRSKINVGVGETSLVSSEDYRHPLTKIAARRLSRYLSQHACPDPAAAPFGGTEESRPRPSGGTPQP
ncbi:MAG: NAD(P)/FAD-dependent oxidoreductase [Verrucomicrobiota bacterium]